MVRRSPTPSGRPEAHSSGAGPESYRAFVTGAGWSRQEWVSWVRNTLSRDIFTNAAATRDGLPTSKMTAELNHPDGTGDGSKASILVQLAAHQAPMVASGRPSVPILEPPAPISFASVDPRDRSPSGYLLGAAVWGEKAHHPPAPIIGGTNQHVHPERTHLLSEQRIGRLATANRESGVSQVGLVWRSDGDDVNDVFKSCEVIAVAGVQIETVSVCGRCDQQVRESAARLASFADDGGDYETVAAHGRAIEPERLQLRLDFLQPRLPFRRTAGVAARCGPAASSAAVIAEIAIWSGNAATTIGSCQSTTTEVSSSPDVTSQSLVDHLVEVSSKSMPVDSHANCRQRRDLLAGDEGAAAGLDRPKLGDRFAVARNDECFASRHGIDHLCVLVAQLALRDGLRHALSVAWCATIRD